MSTDIINEILNIINICNEKVIQAISNKSLDSQSLMFSILCYTVLGALVINIGELYITYEQGRSQKYSLEGAKRGQVIK